jgi:hypothetical protein
MPCADKWEQNATECGSSQSDSEQEVCDNLSLWKQYTSDVMNAINENGYSDWCRKSYLPEYEPHRRKYFKQSLVTEDCTTGLMNIMCLKHGTEPLSSDSSEAGAIARIVQNVEPPVRAASHTPHTP